jgi:nitroreductase
VPCMTSRDLTPDELLSTTRTVRKRLDLTRPVERELLEECLDLAFQAPTGGNLQGWHFVLVTEPSRKKALADLYQKSKRENDPLSVPPENQRIMNASAYLAEHLHQVPVLVIPCIEGRTENIPFLQQAVTWGSILPATWSFMLAARARGLGTAWTSLHLAYEREAAAVLGIPYEKLMQVALIPVAHTIGTEFKPGPRILRDVHWRAGSGIGTSTYVNIFVTLGIVATRAESIRRPAAEQSNRSLTVITAPTNGAH